MKCPKCGTTNGKTNRYCRGCGFKLEGLAQQSQQTDAVACAPDEVALGEELFELWQYYSSGSLDVALAKAEKIVDCNPDSAAAHNILALIYEKKAENELAAGNEDGARDLLKLAIEQYERIIDLNPNSAADREKLASLRLMLAGGPVAAVRPKRALDFRAAMSAIPTPYLAGAVTMLVLLILGIIVFLPGRGADRSTKPAEPRSGRSAQKLKSVSTPGATAAAPGAGDSGALRVYTFPPPVPRDTTTGAARIPAAPPASGRLRIPSEQVKLPSLAGAKVEVVPESKKAPSSTKPQAAQAGSEESGRGQIKIGPARPGDEQSSREPDGDSTLARAIELYNQGKTDEAIRTAEQAAELYQADADAGRNVTTAKRGAENARKLIQLWRQSTAPSPT